MAKLKPHSIRPSSAKPRNILYTKYSTRRPSFKTSKVNLGKSQLSLNCNKSNLQNGVNLSDSSNSVYTVDGANGNSTFSKDLSDSPVSNSGSGKSRYGRTHKPKINEDFLPTDKKVGAILGLSPKQSNGCSDLPSLKEVKKAAKKLFENLPENESPNNLHIPKKRGRPRKILQTSHDPNLIIATGGSTSFRVNLEATNPVVTIGASTSVPVKLELTEIPNQTDVALPCNQISCDWVAGDLAWARVGRQPYWPCIIAVDPELKAFSSVQKKGRFCNPTLHVQFFADKGRRSWVFAGRVMKFEGKVAFIKEAERVHTLMKRKYKKLKKSICKAYSAPVASKDKWENAVKQAESFMKKTREQRIDYFDKQFPAKAVTPKKERDPSPIIVEKPKKPERSVSKVRRSIKEEPKKRESAAAAVAASSAKKRKSSVRSEETSQTPIKMIKVEPGTEEMCTSPDRTPPAKKTYRRKLGPDFKAFVTEHFSLIADEYPHMNEDEVEDYLREIWAEMAPNERARYQPSEESFLQDSSDLSSESTEDVDGDNEHEVRVIKHTTSSVKKGGSLFRGYVRERVCQICFLPGDTVKCRGPCCGSFHLACNSIGAPVKQEVLDVEDENSSIPVQEVKPRLSELEEGAKDIGENMKNKHIRDNKSFLSFSSTSSETTAVPNSSPKSSVKSEQSLESNKDKDDPNSGFRCRTCAEATFPPCFACGLEINAKTQCDARQRCAVGQCGKFYHPECLKAWPQAVRGHGGPSRRQSAAMSKGASSYEEIFTCPRHVCHTCASDDPRNASMRLQNQSLVWCIQCPTAYHTGNYCLPAGSEILTASQIICPRHYVPPKKGNYHINASWCSLCTKGGSLICCDLCPNSFHLDCLGPLPAPEDGYICEDCDTGRFPLYGEVVWVKLGSYRWWPAVILYPNQIPENIKNLPHRRGEFAVKFFGSHDHYWVNRGRVFFYQEGDTGIVSHRKSAVDETFQRALAEALDAHQKMKGEKAMRETEVRQGLKPPPYIRIKANRPVGNVRLAEANPASMTPCDCGPNSENPCGPDSDCINRYLLVECSPGVCGAGDKCRNQCFERREYPPLVPYKTEARGWGLKTLADIKKGEFVIEYVGELIDEAEYRRRLDRKHQQKDENYYFLTIDKDRMLDAGPKGNIARFMNHSCQPNCETQKWTVNGDTRVGLFALRDIPKDTELTFNYNLVCVGPDKKPCMCGAPNCSGFIGVKAVKQTSVDSDKKSRLDPQHSSKFKKRKKKKKLKLSESSVCFQCGKDSPTIQCDTKSCPKLYHLECVNLKRQPTGVWVCPWHRCNICNKRTSRLCNYCPSSFCFDHSDGNVSFCAILGLVCKDHDKAVLLKEKSKSTKSPKPSTSSSDLPIEEKVSVKKEKVAPSSAAMESELAPEGTRIEDIHVDNLSQVTSEVPFSLTPKNKRHYSKKADSVKIKSQSPLKSSAKKLGSKQKGKEVKSPLRIKVVKSPSSMGEGKVKSPLRIKVVKSHSSMEEGEVKSPLRIKVVKSPLNLKEGEVKSSLRIEVVKSPSSIENGNVKSPLRIKVVKSPSKMENGKVKSPKIEFVKSPTSLNKPKKERIKNKKSPGKVIGIVYNGGNPSRISNRKRQPPKKITDYYNDVPAKAPKLANMVEVKKEVEVIEYNERKDGGVVRGYKEEERSPKERKTILQRIDHKIKSETGYITIEEAMSGIRPLNGKMPGVVNLLGQAYSQSPVLANGITYPSPPPSVNHSNDEACGGSSSSFSSPSETKSLAGEEIKVLELETTPPHNPLDNSSAFLLSVGS